MMTARHILLVEDEHAIGTALSILVRRMGHLPALAATATAGLKAIAETEYAALVLDIGLPDMSGLEFLKRLRKSHPALPVLVITAHATLDHAIDATKSGATAYLNKPLDLDQFEQTLTSLLQAHAAGVVPAPRISQSATLIGAAPGMRHAFIGIAHACAGDVPALIHGPSGSGKSLAAAIIHANGPRAGQAFRTVSCRSLSESDAPWKTGVNPQGTLVLDEITALAHEQQSQLAAWLADAQAMRPHILATSSSNPREAMETASLREDLFYALSALTIPMPALRERSGDIEALGAYFLGLHRGAASAPVITTRVLATLQSYPWPGNIRELRHVIEYAATLSGGGPILLSHLPAHVAASSSQGCQAPAAGELELVVSRWLDARLAASDTESASYDDLLEQIESVMLRHLLQQHENRPTRMAAALRMHRATLRQKLRRMGLQTDEA